ncbi:MAG: hypothetical protein U0270_13100 [Labilithrix sp.]
MATQVWGASDVLVRRRPQIWPYFAIAAAALAIPTVAEIYIVSALVGLAILLLLFFLPAILYDDAQRRVAVVHADREGLRFGKSLVLPRARIDACAVEPLAEGMCNVHLWGPGRRDDVSLLVPDPERARLLIEALGLKSDRHAARFVVESAPLRPRGIARLIRLVHLLGAAMLVAAVILLTLQSEWIGFTLVPLMFAYFGLLRRLRRRRSITLGADALTVDQPIPLSEIRSVKAGPGTDARVDDMLLRFDGRDAAGKRDAFVERLQKSLGARDDVPVAAMLEPGAREEKAWLAELRRLGGDSYRGGGLPTEELWRVVEHVAAPPGARIGALAVLLTRLDDEGRVRLAHIAEGTVKPDVRAALEAASEVGTTDEEVVRMFQK